ncbi:hypothetical protein B0H14DRAFT_3503065 [Mycena olivaceomarginata]|nr:hypothetical protein B0H14DRAFT_3503065 [Mycena olivaceomarginata]
MYFATTTFLDKRKFFNLPRTSKIDTGDFRQRITLTQTHPWWPHDDAGTVKKDLSVHSTSQVDYPRATTTADDSCDGGQAANEPEARERSRCRGQPLSRHVNVGGEGERHETRRRGSHVIRQQDDTRDDGRCTTNGSAHGSAMRIAARQTRRQRARCRCEKADYIYPTQRWAIDAPPPRCTPHADRHSARTPEAQAPIEGAGAGLRQPCQSFTTPDAHVEVHLTARDARRSQRNSLLSIHGADTWCIHSLDSGGATPLPQQHATLEGEC